MFGGAIMRPIGNVLITEHNDSYHTLRFQVVDRPSFLKDYVTLATPHL